MSIQTTLQPDLLKSVGNFGTNNPKTIIISSTYPPNTSWATGGSPRVGGTQRFILDNPQGLTNFNPSYVSQFSSVDLAGCRNLVICNLGGTYATSINIEGCSNLYNINLYNTRVVNINAKGCENLTFAGASFSYTVESVDFSDCINLRSFRCAYSKLTSFDSSNNPQLEELNLMWNDITSIDVRGTNLRVFHVSYNPITSVIGLEDFDHAYGGTCTIGIRYCNLDSTNLIKIANDLPTITSTGSKSIDFFGNPGTASAKATVIPLVSGKGWTPYPSS